LHLASVAMELKSFSNAGEQRRRPYVETPRLGCRRERLQDCLRGGNAARTSARYARRAQ